MSFCSLGRIDYPVRYSGPMARLEGVLLIRLLSRTMKDLLFGEPIVKLPFDHRSIKQIDAKKSEELLYFAIELRLRELRQMDFEKYDERSCLQNPLAQRTRLRQ